MQTYDLKIFSKFVLNKLKNIKEIPVNPCCIFDIDNTLIDTSGNLIQPVFDIYSYCISMGFSIVIVTCRPSDEHNVKETLLQLKYYGIHNIESFYFMKPHAINPYDYKEKCRFNVKNRGLNTIMSIGDMPWDIGNYGGIGFIVPKIF